MSYTLEIACFTPAGALMAAEAGAHRIELCDNPAEGGTTPSAGVLRILRRKIHIPVFPIIRPRGGHFVFSPAETEMMLADILLCKQLGYEGVVIGSLHPDGTVDEAATARMVEAAWPMEVTFHRAFDRTRDPLEALEAVIRCGCQRILTSGQQPDVHDATELVAQLVEAAGERIIIMPGSGVKSGKLTELVRQTGAREYHASARTAKSDPGVYNAPAMRETLDQTLVDPAEIRAMLAVLRQMEG